MIRLILHIAYHGKNYAGFQFQQRQKTIQHTLEQAFQKILGEEVRVIPCSRTDRGVHALSQVVHVELKHQRSKDRIQKNFLYRINAVLPKDITVTQCRPAAQDFHARKQAKKKTYAYFILISPRKNPFISDYVWHIPKPLDIKAMKQAAVLLVGKHDFSAFAASDSTATNKTRELIQIAITPRCPAPFFRLKGERYIQFEFTGTGFLKQMIRIIMGTLIAVGRGKLTPLDVKTILHAQDRRKAPATAPAQGLFLTKVLYSD